MTDDTELARLWRKAERIASANDAAVESHERNGEWIFSIEPTGERHGDWAVTGSGYSESEALTDLIDNAEDTGYA